MLRILGIALAFVASAGAIRLMLGSGLAARLLDRPNERSLHDRPVPRSGGLGVMAGIASAAMTLLPSSLIWVLPAAALCTLSLVDDWRSLPVSVRLVGHLLAAGGFVAVALSDAGLGTSLLLVVAISWMINLYNFMDGSDGLAGGMAVAGFGTYALAAWGAGDAVLAAGSLGIAAAALGFLLFNFPPARIFMGDAGSIPLGFLASAFGLLGWRDGLWPLWFPVLVFSPFIVDASVTLVRRVLRGERVWQAHRTHYYQRMVQVGWGHRRTALIEYGLMLACGGGGLLAMRLGPRQQWIFVAACAAAYALLMFVFDRFWRSRAATA